MHASVQSHHTLQERRPLEVTPLRCRNFAGTIAIGPPSPTPTQMLAVLSSFPSLVINAPVVQPTGVVVQQVQSPVLAQPLSGAAIFPTSLQADLLDDFGDQEAVKKAQLRAAVR